MAERALEAEIDRIEAERRQRNGHPPLAGDTASVPPETRGNEETKRRRTRDEGSHDARRPAIVNSARKKGGDKPPTAKGGIEEGGPAEGEGPEEAEDASPRGPAEIKCAVTMAMADILFSKGRYDEAARAYHDAGKMFASAKRFGLAAEAAQWAAIAYNRMADGISSGHTVMFQGFDRELTNVVDHFKREEEQLLGQTNALVEVAKGRIETAQAFRDEGYTDFAVVWFSSAVSVIESIDPEEGEVGGLTEEMASVRVAALREVAAAWLESAEQGAAKIPSDESLPPDIVEQFEEAVDVHREVGDSKATLAALERYRRTLLAHGDVIPAQELAERIGELKGTLGDQLGVRRARMEADRFPEGYDVDAEVDRFLAQLERSAEIDMEVARDASPSDREMAQSHLCDAVASLHKVSKLLYVRGKSAEAFDKEMQVLELLAQIGVGWAAILVYALGAYNNSLKGGMTDSAAKIDAFFSKYLFPAISQSPDALNLGEGGLAEFTRTAQRVYVRARYCEHRKQYRTAIADFVESACALVALGAYGEALSVLRRAETMAHRFHETTQLPAIQFIRVLIGKLPGGTTPSIANGATARIVSFLVPEGYDFQRGLRGRELLGAIVHPSEKQSGDAEGQAVAEFITLGNDFGIRDRHALAAALRAPKHPLRQLLREIAVTPEELERAANIIGDATQR